MVSGGERAEAREQAKMRGRAHDQTMTNGAIQHKIDAVRQRIEKFEAITEEMVKQHATPREIEDIRGFVREQYKTLEMLEAMLKREKAG